MSRLHIIMLAYWNPQPPPPTYECGAPVSQRVTLVAGNAEGRQFVEKGLQQGLQSGGWGVGRVKQVENLGAGWMELIHWGSENTKGAQARR